MHVFTYKRASQHDLRTAAACVRDDIVKNSHSNEMPAVCIGARDNAPVSVMRGQLKGQQQMKR